MASKKNRTCCVCGKKYEFCPACKRTLNDDMWKMSFDSENCRDIYQACARFKMGHITAQETKDILIQCDISDFDSFTDSTKQIFHELFDDE